jgi:hypothetical protein
LESLRQVCAGSDLARSAATTHSSTNSVGGAVLPWSSLRAGCVDVYLTVQQFRNKDPEGIALGRPGAQSGRFRQCLLLVGSRPARPGGCSEMRGAGTGRVARSVVLDILNLTYASASAGSVG